MNINSAKNDGKPRNCPSKEKNCQRAKNKLAAFHSQESIIAPGLAQEMSQRGSTRHRRSHAGAQKYFEERREKLHPRRDDNHRYRFHQYEHRRDENVSRIVSRMRIEMDNPLYCVVLDEDHAARMVSPRA
ncbi:MAG: hypothetical protein KBA71_06605 [Opitutaceae bacterium]|nr:hypothetical protein [Opitutaceae bacterium]